MSKSALLAILCVALVGGCVAKPDIPLQKVYFAGDYGAAREYAAKKIVVPKNAKQDTALSDREYILSRMRFALAAMSDGYCSDDPIFSEVYDRLSQQGINDASKGIAVVFNEDLKQWKGEPFEQALMLSYLSMYHAAQGSWDNAHAAAGASQFRLKDFGNNKQGKRRTNEDLVREAAAAGNEDEKFLNSYTARETDFCLGILLDALANQQIGRAEEAESKFALVAKIQPELAPLTEELARGAYTDLLVVSWGHGPQKIGTGPDQAIADWQVHTPSAGEPLLVSVGGSGPRPYPLVCDVNQMATDHMWNNLQDVRKAKSVIGTVLVGAGAGVTAYGIDQDSTGTALAGVGMILAGAALKAGAHADTRYCDVMPQRFYVVPINASRESKVTVEVAGHPASRMTLAGLAPSAKGQPAALRYVNLIARTPAPPEWAASGAILYNNDARPTAVERPWPYIFGGDCVRKPTQAALSDYQKNGYLNNLSVDELQRIYRMEGLVFDGNETLRSRHVLEGGNSLEGPMAGTAGFARLFGQRHPPYKAKTPYARELTDQFLSQSGKGQIAANR